MLQGQSSSLNTEKPARAQAKKKKKLSSKEEAAKDSQKTTAQNIDKLNDRADKLITWFEDNNRRAEELN